MTAKDKAAIMAAMRERRKKEGLVQINVWVCKEHVRLVREYARKLRVKKYIQGLARSGAADQL